MWMDILIAITCVAALCHMVVQSHRDRLQVLWLARIANTLYVIEELHKETNNRLSSQSDDLGRLVKYINKLENAERERFWGSDHG